MNEIKKNLRNLGKLTSNEVYFTLETLNAEAWEREQDGIQGFDFILSYLNRNIDRCKRELDRRSAK